jgi:putative transposon-encoded protein
VALAKGPRRPVLRLCVGDVAWSISEEKEAVMRLLRRVTYIGTGGMVDLRTDKELIERYAKKLSKERKKTGKTRSAPFAARVLDCVDRVGAQNQHLLPIPRRGGAGSLTGIAAVGALRNTDDHARDERIRNFPSFNVRGRRVVSCAADVDPLRGGQRRGWCC